MDHGSVREDHSQDHHRPTTGESQKGERGDLGRTEGLVKGYPRTPGWSHNVGWLRSKHGRKVQAGEVPEHHGQDGPTCAATKPNKEDWANLRPTKELIDGYLETPRRAHINDWLRSNQGLKFLLVEVPETYSQNGPMAATTVLLRASS